GATGRVLSVLNRNDQLIEDIHDLSFFHDLARIYWLPFVAVALALLAATGIWIYIDPVLRRRRFKKKQASGK
ncbi:MAG TPA: hypothetical protein VEX38_07145, partial [Fimbriimonadaceae bacterium]|nr:hypothetical protein [Fimbriimonadaceae bacterium]